MYQLTLDQKIANVEERLAAVKAKRHNLIVEQNNLEKRLEKLKRAKASQTEKQEAPESYSTVKSLNLTTTQNFQ